MTFSGVTLARSTSAFYKSTIRFTAFSYLSLLSHSPMHHHVTFFHNMRTLILFNTGSWNRTTKDVTYFHGFTTSKTYRTYTALEQKIIEKGHVVQQHQYSKIYSAECCPCLLSLGSSNSL